MLHTLYELYEFLSAKNSDWVYSRKMAMPLSHSF